MHLQTVPLGIRDQVQASTGIAVEVGANWINGGYMATITQDIQQSVQRLAALNDPAALQKYLATTPYTADQLAAATGYKVADLQSALTSARAAQPNAEQWAPAQNVSLQSNVSQMTGGDPGIGYNPNTQYQAAKLTGFSGTYDQWAQQQAAYKAQAQRDLAANPNVVVGGYTPSTQLSAVQNAQLPPSTMPGGQQTPGGASTGGASGGLFQGVDVNSYQQNPYLAQMGQVLTNKVTDNLNRNIMPGIRSNAVMAGGFGGSRQGVVEANAMKDANSTISDALTGAYFQDFTNQMNRNLQQYGQNQNFYSNQRGQDLQQTQLGANLFNMGNQGFLSQGQGLYGLGSQQQQAPWQVINNGNAGFGQWSGFGTTTQAGGGAQGALGGALAGGQLGSLWGSSPNAAGGANSAGFGTGAGFGNQDFGQFF